MIYSKILIGLSLSSGALASQGDDHTAIQRLYSPKYERELQAEFRQLHELRKERLEEFRSKGLKYHKIDPSQLPGRKSWPLLYQLRGEKYLNDHDSETGYPYVDYAGDHVLLVNPDPETNILSKMGLIRAKNTGRMPSLSDVLLRKKRTETQSVPQHKAPTAAQRPVACDDERKVNSFEETDTSNRISTSTSTTSTGTGSTNDVSGRSSGSSRTEDSVAFWADNPRSGTFPLNDDPIFIRDPYIRANTKAFNQNARAKQDTHPGTKIRSDNVTTGSTKIRRRLARQGFAKRLERFAREEAYVSS